MPGSIQARTSWPPPPYRRQPLHLPQPRTFLLLALVALLLLQPPHPQLLLPGSATGGGLTLAAARHTLAATADITARVSRSRNADDGDVPDGGDGSAAEVCSNTCYRGLAEGTSAACKLHDFKPGLYQMMTDARTRQAAQSHFGDRTRLRAALRRFAKGANLTIATVGGSITAGQGAVDAPPYPRWLHAVLDGNLPHMERVKVHNGAVPGTSSQYMSSCHNVHVPQEADIIFVEYAVNDDEMPMPHMDNQIRRPYERLLRKLLAYPKRPAVVLLHGFRWFQLPVEFTGRFWVSGERQQSEFGLFYGLPQLSIKACCYHHMAEGKKGFQVKRPRADPNGRIQHENFVDAQLREVAFYYDIVHPDGNTGHRVMGEVAAQLVLDAWADVSAGFTLGPRDVAAMSAQLPPPMLPHNMESASDKCFIGPAFQRTVVDTDGFEWINEGKSPEMPKWGYVATKPDMVIRFKVDTRSAGPDKDAMVTLELGHLRSYENMGKAAVRCEGGCSCDPWTLDGHQHQHHSQTFLFPFKVSQAEECIIEVKVLHETQSGKHKVKVTGIMVSEDPHADAFQNWAAFDWVSSASAKDPQGVFEISNTARRSLAEAGAASSEQIQRRYYEALLEAATAAGGGTAAEGGG